MVAQLTRLLRRRRTITWFGLAGMVLGLAIGLFMGTRYTAEAEFIQQARRQNNLASFAAQLGINIGALGETESVVFYNKLIKSRDLLREVALHEYRFPASRQAADTVSGTLLALYGAGGKTREDSLNAFLKRLERDIYVAIDMRAEVVTLKVTAPWPVLAERLTRRILDLVNEFNLEKRQSQARAERRFVEGRLEQSRSELAEAEARQVQFLLRNARYQESPELRLQADQLQREVDFRQEVVTSLARAFEEARVNEVRDTPVITVLEQPEGTAVPSRKAPLLALLGLLMGSLAGVGTVLGQARIQAQRRAYPVAYAEFEVARRDLRDAFSFRRLLRAVRAPNDGGDGSP